VVPRNAGAESTAASTKSRHPPAVRWRPYRFRRARRWTAFPRQVAAGSTPGGLAVSNHTGRGASGPPWSGVEAQLAFAHNMIQPLDFGRQHSPPQRTQPIVAPSRILVSRFLSQLLHQAALNHLLQIVV